MSVPNFSHLNGDKIASLRFPYNLNLNEGGILKFAILYH